MHNWEGVIGVTRTDNLTNVLVLKEIQVKSEGKEFIYQHSLAVNVAKKKEFNCCKSKHIPSYNVGELLQQQKQHILENFNLHCRM